jgi:hypothetical protein
MVFIIVRKNSFNLYTPQDSVDDRLYMTEAEVYARFAELEARQEYKGQITIAGA